MKWNMDLGAGLSPELQGFRRVRLAAGSGIAGQPSSATFKCTIRCCLIVHLKPRRPSSFWLCPTCAHAEQIQNVRVTHCHFSVKKHPTPTPSLPRSTWASECSGPGSKKRRRKKEQGHRHVFGSTLVQLLFPMIHVILLFIHLITLNIMLNIIWNESSSWYCRDVSLSLCLFLFLFSNQHYMWLQSRGEVKEGQAGTVEDAARAAHESFLWRLTSIPSETPSEKHVNALWNVNKCHFDAPKVVIVLLKCCFVG